MQNTATISKTTENKFLLNTNKRPPPLKTNNASNIVSKNLCANVILNLPIHFLPKPGIYFRFFKAFGR